MSSDSVSESTATSKNEDNKPKAPKMIVVKMNDKIDDDELSIREGLASIFSEPKFTEKDPYISLQTLLGDGVLICQLANKIKKGTIARINPSNSLRFMLVVCYYYYYFFFSLSLSLSFFFDDYFIFSYLF